MGQDPKCKKTFNYNDVGRRVTSVDEKIVSYDDVGKQAVHVDAYNAQSEPSRPTEGRKIFGLTRKTFISGVDQARTLMENALYLWLSSRAAKHCILGTGS